MNFIIHLLLSFFRLTMEQAVLQ